MLQVRAEQRNRGELVVSKLQVQQGGYVEYGLGESFITQPVAIQSHERQLSEIFEVISEQTKMMDEKNNCII